MYFCRATYHGESRRPKRHGRRAADASLTTSDHVVSQSVAAAHMCSSAECLCLKNNSGPISLFIASTQGVRAHCLQCAACARAATVALHTPPPCPARQLSFHTLGYSPEAASCERAYFGASPIAVSVLAVSAGTEKVHASWAVSTWHVFIDFCIQSPYATLVEQALHIFDPSRAAQKC